MSKKSQPKFIYQPATGFSRSQLKKLKMFSRGVYCASRGDALALLARLLCTHGSGTVGVILVAKESRVDAETWRMNARYRGRVVRRDWPTEQELTIARAEFLMAECE
jgi:hypothetical protein